MSWGVFSLVLLAAMLHASWNAIVKGGGDTRLSSVLVAGGCALVAAPGLWVLPPPAAASWPFLSASAVLQGLYFVLLARAYRVADMSQVYPLMRGTAPVLVTVVGFVWLGEILSGAALLGIGVICLGMFGMAVGWPRAARVEGVPSALGNALVIAAYTLIDGVGVRRSGAPVAYSLWLFVLTGVPLVLWALHAQGRAFADYARRHWRFGLIGGAGSLASYGLALWAMTQAPVAMVAALRETSILFGTLLSWLLLHETVGLRRVLAAGLIAAGAMALRMG